MPVIKHKIGSQLKHPVFQNGISRSGSRSSEVLGGNRLHHRCFSSKAEHLPGKLRPAAGSFAGCMEHAVIFRKEQRINRFGKLRSACGRSELVAYHSHLFISFGKTEHGLGKILAVAIQPGRPQNKISVCKILYKIFSCQLGRAICALRIGGIRFHIRPVPFPSNT